jgi:predicted metalloprotease with PDZ domain
MTHELLHVSLPSLSREHTWLSEGIATYVEPVVRARDGQITAEKFWRDLLDGLPQGLPEAGDEGLERTHTWGRTYWGGSLFCFVADVTLRERTQNARSLDDVLRAVVATGATVESHWEIERFLDVGDRATGLRVLHELYDRMGLAPGTIDLPALWSRLGVIRNGDRVAFDDRAPLALIRRSIAGPSNSASR